MPDRSTHPILAEAPRGSAGALGCLVMIGRAFGLHLTVDGLMADHELVGDPGPAVLAGCAERAGFRCRPLTLDWSHLQDLKRALPAVVWFKDGRSFVLTRVEERQGTPEVVLHDPAGNPDEPTVLLRAAFELAWSGDILLLKKAAAASGADLPVGWPLLSAMLRGQGRLLRDLVLSSVLLAVLALGPVLFARALVAHMPDAAGRSTVVFLACGIVVLVLFEGAFAIVRQGLLTRLVTRVVLQLDTLLFERLLRLPVTLFETMPLGALTHRLDRVEAVAAMLAGGLAGGLLDAGILAVFVPAMLVTSPLLGTIVLLLLAAAAGLALLLNGRYRRASAAVEAANVENDVLLARTLAGFAAIKSLALEDRQLRQWDVANARTTRLRLAEADAARALETVAHLFERLLVYGPFALGVGLAVSGTGGLSQASLFGFLLMSWRVARPLGDVVGIAHRWNAGRDALATLSALVDAPPEATRGRAGIREPIKGAIAFSGVQFTYPGAIVPALESVSFEVAAGAVVGIMGRSGAGKSTIARLLQRLHADYQGLIKIDGIDVREFDVDHLRAHLAVVDQDSPMFPGSIRENLVAGRPDATDEAVAYAIRLVGAEAFIDGLPHGTATWLGEHGAPLSDGQRQRLAIARAIVADPAILILDEATSALDPESEALVTGNLKRIAQGRTLIVVSQRLAMLAQAESVIVLDRGEVQDIGRHADLIERSDLYSGLWRRQTARLQRPARHDETLPRSSHVA